MLGLGLVALLVNLPWGYGRWLEHELTAHGQVTQAAVVKTGTGGLVDYRLPARLGVGDRSWTVRVDADAFAVAQRTHRLPVRYLPDDPTRNQPVGLSSGSFLPLVTLLADLALLLVAVMLLRHRRAAAVQVEALTAVDPAPGATPGVVEEAGELVVVGTLLDARRSRAVDGSGGRLELDVPVSSLAPGGRVVVQLGAQRNRGALRDVVRLRARALL